MKKSIKIFLTVVLVVTAIILCLGVYVFAVTSAVNLDENKLVDTVHTVEFYDSDGNFIEEHSNGIAVTEYGDIKEYTKKAFIAIEDKRFYEHGGIDVRGIFRALGNNLKSFSFKEGASTITQQLIKNTHLSGEKTFTRKLAEMKLALMLEKKYSKDEILEKYLNTIYFGDGCYGITRASEHYFGKSPTSLTINESAVLAGLIKAPALYSPYRNKAKCEQRKNTVLKAMYEQKYISKTEYENNISYFPEINDEDISYDYVYLARKQSQDIFDVAPYENKTVKIYTYLDRTIQNALENGLNGYDGQTDKASVVIDCQGKIRAYSSTCGNANRQLGSVIKPLLVYAPAIETDTICGSTPINDEKASFNGYTPSNFNDKYYGFVSAKDALAKSLNTCAVKILNATGIEKAKKYLDKTSVKLSDEDNTLSIALGATKSGTKLTEITGAYTVFMNNGRFYNPTCIKKIVLSSGRILYNDETASVHVFGDDTTAIVNDMLQECVNTGTAKYLNFLPYNLYAKTGTAGVKEGNTDAYCISYNAEYVLGTWIGNANGDLMPNSFTGGNQPAKISAAIWKNVYKNGVYPNDIPKSDNVIEVKLDKESYISEHALTLADSNAPDRYVIKGLFKKSNLPKARSERFSFPVVKNPQLFLNDKNVTITFEKPEYYDCIIYRTRNGCKEKIFDTALYPQKQTFTDYYLQSGNYVYSIVPYYNDGRETHIGKEVFLPSVKIYDSPFYEDWWFD